MLVVQRFFREVIEPYLKKKDPNLTLESRRVLLRNNPFELTEADFHARNYLGRSGYGAIPFDTTPIQEDLRDAIATIEQEVLATSQKKEIPRYWRKEAKKELELLDGLLKQIIEDSEVRKRLKSLNHSEPLARLFVLADQIRKAAPHEFPLLVQQIDEMSSLLTLAQDKMRSHQMKLYPIYLNPVTSKLIADAFQQMRVVAEFNVLMKKGRCKRLLELM